MRGFICFLGIILVCGSVAAQNPSNLGTPPSPEGQTLKWPKGLPVYDHVVIVILENKDYSEIIGNSRAPYINEVLRAEGANFTQAHGEEHFSQGNYYWLFSGDNQTTGFYDQVPSASNNPNYPFKAHNLGERLIAKKGKNGFKGYAESLPAIGSTVDSDGAYARKHVPWISFANVPNGTTVNNSSNLRFADFPDAAHYNDLPTVSIIIPNLDHDMHNCWPPNCELSDPNCCIEKADAWLRENIDPYYQWAKDHNSLLILTFDENNDKRFYHGLSTPGVDPEAGNCTLCRELCADLQNRIVTVFAGARIKPGDYPEGKGITHVNMLRTLEAMYKLSKSGAQQPNAAGIGITDDYLITDVFTSGQ